MGAAIGIVFLVSLEDEIGSFTPTPLNTNVSIKTFNIWGGGVNIGSVAKTIYTRNAAL